MALRVTQIKLPGPTRTYEVYDEVDIEAEGLHATTLRRARYNKSKEQLRQELKEAVLNTK